jgi:membrane-associated phospholipid phosphatase
MTRALESDPHSTPPPSNWAVRRTIAQTWHQFRSDWSHLAPGTFKRWAWTILIGLLLCLALTTVMSKLGPSLADRGMQDWDRRLLLSIERSPISIQSAILLESPGNFLYLIPVTLVATVLAARSHRPMLAITLPTAYVLARPLFLLGFYLWDRPRPRLILNGLASPPFDSFPSGHVVQAVAVYGLLAYAWAARSNSLLERTLITLLLILWITTVGLARIRLGAHWPTDVMAGTVIGAAWLLTLILALRSANRPNPSRLE